jgi:hypothetical protein
VAGDDPGLARTVGRAAGGAEPVGSVTRYHARAGMAIFQRDVRDRGLEVSRIRAADCARS